MYSVSTHNFSSRMLPQTIQGNTFTQIYLAGTKHKNINLRRENMHCTRFNHWLISLYGPRAGKHTTVKKNKYKLHLLIFYTRLIQLSGRGQWEEAEVPGENPRIHGENMQTPHRKAPGGDRLVHIEAICWTP